MADGGLFHSLDGDPWVGDWYPGRQGLALVAVVVLVAGLLAGSAAVIAHPRSAPVQPAAPGSAYDGIVVTGVHSITAPTGSTPVPGLGRPAAPAGTPAAGWHASNQGWVVQRPAAGRPVAWLPLGPASEPLVVGAQLTTFGTVPGTGIGPALRLGAGSYWVLARDKPHQVQLLWWRAGQPLPLLSADVPDSGRLALGLHVDGENVVVWVGGQLAGIVHLPHRHGTLAAGLAAVPTQAHGAILAELSDAVVG